MNLKSVFVFTLCAAATAMAQRTAAPVPTEYGLVQGIAEKDLTVYRGIPFAAPPVLMVAATWAWDLNFMMVTFGWKAAALPGNILLKLLH